MKLPGIKKYFNTVNGNIVDFEQIDKFGRTILSMLFCNNRIGKFNLTNEQFDYLIKNSDLKKIQDNWNSLMFALACNKTENLNLTNEQFDYLIKNSDLNIIDKHGWSPLTLALQLNHEENLNLSKEQLKYLIENSDLSLVIDKEKLINLKQVQSELLNYEILSKIDINQEIKKNNKI